ncbi:MAG: hypothetical protein IJ323_06065 [Clostridia bacterium]|nr:hypothetical protein [Clostridia bacterium]
MKQLFAFVLVLISLTFIPSCSKDESAFEKSSEAYNEITTAYKIADEMGADVYEACRLGIYEKEKILGDAIGVLSKELALSRDDIRESIVYTSASWLYLDYEELSEEERTEYLENANIIVGLFEDDLSSFCVDVAYNTYVLSGKADEAKTALENAKDKMKELSEKHSDYEHYPNVKGYYTKTFSLFNICQASEGTLEQLKKAINNYRNDAREFKSNLDFIFE